MSGDVLTRGQAAFRQHCQACHGADMRGVLPGMPSLVGVTSRIDADAIRAIVQEGQGQMRPLLEIGSADLNAIVTYLTATNPFGRGGGPVRAGGPPLPPGPVVASGGAPQPPAAGARHGPVLSRASAATPATSRGRTTLTRRACRRRAT